MVGQRPLVRPWTGGLRNARRRTACGSTERPRARRRHFGTEAPQHHHGGVLTDGWRRFHARSWDRWRTAILFGTVVVAGLTVSAAVGALRTRGQVRAAATASLGNYATVATEQFVNAYESQLRQNFVPILPPPGYIDPDGQRDPFPVADLQTMIHQMAHDPCHCLTSPGPSTLFRLGPGPADSEVRDTLGGPLAALAPAIRETVEHFGDSLTAIGARYGFTSVRTGAANDVVFYSRRRDSLTGAVFSYGFVVPARHLAARIFEPVFRTIRLVPRHLLTTVKSNEDYLEIDVIGAGGQPLFSTGDRYREGPSDALVLPGIRGGLVVRAHLNPTIKDALIPGGVPGPIPWREIAMSGLALLMTLAIAALGLRAAELARLRTDFALSVTHELRTPLTQIRLAAETVLLGRARDPASAARSMESIVGETHRLQQLVDNVLHFSRAERRETTARRADRHPAGRRGGGGRVRAAGRRARHHDPGGGARGSPGPCQRSALRQIVLNLLDNAARYGPDGQTIVVSGGIREGRVELWVDDQGPGIPVRDRGRVWNAVRSARTSPGGGSDRYRAGPGRGP